mmetsp:Transcript_1879/g.2953  ORF Transcript_1879/g.2953 Transcript_1879/m.2953 type:complete len:727 (-) Transcript_1879:341-2521(-)
MLAFALLWCLWPGLTLGDTPPASESMDEKVSPIVHKIIESQQRLEDPMPILLIPGFASSRLRAYTFTDCPGNVLDFTLNSDVWLDVGMVLAAKSCFIHCMGLNPEDQSDPENPRCRVRPDQGLDAISELSPGRLTGPLSAVWKYLINMLLEMGFIPDQTLLVAPYDFRLAPFQLEERDGFFTKMKEQIENAVRADERRFRKKHPGTKSRLVQKGLMVIGHSMGNPIFRYFEAWIKYTMGEGPGKEWLRQNVNTYIAVGAPLLGAQFAVQAAVSGLTFGLPISEYDAREMGIGFSSYGMVLPVDPSRIDKRHRLLNNGYTKYPVPVSSVKYPNGSIEQYGASEDIWGASLWQHLQEFDSWSKYVELYIKNLYESDPVMDFMDSWKRPDVQNVYCVYGVNRKTPVSFQFSFPDNGYEHDWDTVMTIYEEGKRVYADDGSPVEVKEPQSHSKSGDGTVSYFSLSWCHTWMQERINITRVPQKAFYETDDLVELRDATIEDYVKLETTGDTGYNTFFEERHQEKGKFGVSSTAVWELDNVDHRAVIFEPVFLEQMSHQLHVQNKVVGRMEKQIEKTIDQMLATISIFPSRGEPAEPISDNDCYWDYSKVMCAFPNHCGYYYQFGDYHLGLSCRLHKNWRKEGGMMTAKHTEVAHDEECECEGYFCFYGLCKFKKPCQSSFSAPGLTDQWGRCQQAVNFKDLQMIGLDKTIIDFEDDGSCQADGTCVMGKG